MSRPAKFYYVSNQVLDMATDEEILDGFGIILFIIAVLSFLVGIGQGIPVPDLLSAIQPIFFLAVAAVAGVAAVLAFLRSRRPRD